MTLSNLATKKFLTLSELESLRHAVLASKTQGKLQQDDLCVGLFTIKKPQATIRVLTDNMRKYATSTEK